MATKASTPKNTKVRESATIELNFDETVDASEIPESRRRSKWNEQLDKLYTATEAGSVPQDDEGNYKFVLIGDWGNENGARGQERTFIDNGLDSTYDFRSVREDGRSKLYARVKTVDAADDAADEDA